MDAPLPKALIGINTALLVAEGVNIATGNHLPNICFVAGNVLIGALSGLNAFIANGVRGNGNLGNGNEQATEIGRTARDLSLASVGISAVSLILETLTL